jgi:hypothetical protein
MRDGKASFVDGKNTEHHLSLKNDSRLIVKPLSCHRRVGI